MSRLNQLIFFQKCQKKKVSRKKFIIKSADLIWAYSYVLKKLDEENKLDSNLITFTDAASCRAVLI